MRGLWHMGLTVEDLDRSLAFYRDIIGMTVDDVYDQGRNPSFDALTGNEGSNTRLCFLSIDIGGRGLDRRPADGLFTLQLFEYRDGAGEKFVPAHNRAGSAHLAFFVEDVDREHARLSERGDVNVTGEIIEHKSARSFYIADPDGLPIELWEEQ